MCARPSRLLGTCLSCVQQVQPILFCRAGRGATATGAAALAAAEAWLPRRSHWHSGTDPTTKPFCGLLLLPLMQRRDTHMNANTRAFDSAHQRVLGRRLETRLPRRSQWLSGIAPMRHMRRLAATAAAAAKARCTSNKRNCESHPFHGAHQRVLRGVHNPVFLVPLSGSQQQIPPWNH